jgi:hypothetical protein
MSNIALYDVRDALEYTTALHFSLISHGGCLQARHMPNAGLLVHSSIQPISLNGT